MAAAAFLGDILQYLKISKDTTKDNVAFRLVTKGSFGVFLICAGLAGLTTWFGDPIVCHSKETNMVIESYCWIHGTVNLKIQQDQKCIKKDENEAKTMYYQWVILVLVASGIMLNLAGWLWSFLEGGLMKSFENQDNKGYKVVKQELQDKTALQDSVKGNADYFEEIRKSKWATTVYYLKFLACQFLAYLFLVLNFQMTDRFLNNKFAWYGQKVTEYYSFSDVKRNQSINPMCNAFPTLVSCTMPKYGTSGVEEYINDFCILRQNIINEKIYLFLWFWFVAMFVIAALQIFVEICFAALPFVRYWFIFHANGTHLSSGMKKYLRDCNHGDIFVLYQISKNTHTSFFSRLLKHLAGDSEDDEEKKAMLSNGPENMEMNEVKTVP